MELQKERPRGEADVTPGNTIERKVGLAQERTEETWRSALLHSLDGRDLVMIAVTVGIVSVFVPWWSSVPLVYIFSMPHWLPTIGGVFFVSGTVLDLRNPVGTIGQVAGIAMFLVETSYNGDYYLWWFAGDGAGLGLFLAAASVVLCLLATFAGGYRKRDDR
ncbi:MAG: hypothetical protein MIO90_02840 [Methanomassiliicoccales archaeon]|nr:hypothetical protein [Methanomassiliicoccales archaeon]